MAEMLSHLECMIIGELNATRMDIQNVLWVEESEEHLDERKKAIMELRERAELDWLDIGLKIRIIETDGIT